MMQSAPRPDYRRPPAARPPAPEPPRTVRYAVLLMLAGAMLEVVAAVVAVKTESSLGPAFAALYPRSDRTFVQSVVVAHAETLVASSVIAAVLWLLMAWANRRARGNGPRITAAVLFVLGTESLWSSFHDVNSAATLTVDVAIWLVGLTVIVLLFGKSAPGLGFGRPHNSPDDGAPVRSDEKAWAAAAYLSVVLLPLVGPLVVYLAVRKQSPFARRHAAQALNTGITLVIYGLATVGLVLLSASLPLLVLLNLVLGAAALAGLVYLVIAAATASRGRDCDVPGWLSFRIVR
jgi:uncharacterized protein